jgi:hypothetical protein
MSAGFWTGIVLIFASFGIFAAETISNSSLQELTWTALGCLGVGGLFVIFGEKN